MRLEISRQRSIRLTAWKVPVKLLVSDLSGDRLPRRWPQIVVVSALLFSCAGIYHNVALGPDKSRYRTLRTAE